MNALWTYFWPAFAAGLVIGADRRLVRIPAARPAREGARRSGSRRAIAAAALWHGPLGAADRFTARVERGARQALDYYEMTKVSAHLHRAPLTRTLILAGPADDFQTSELARLLAQLPGVSSARWTDKSSGPPLIAEAAAVSLAGLPFWVAARLSGRASPSLQRAMDLVIEWILFANIGGSSCLPRSRSRSPSRCFGRASG